MDDSELEKFENYLGRCDAKEARKRQQERIRLEEKEKAEYDETLLDIHSPEFLRQT